MSNVLRRLSLGTTVAKQIADLVDARAMRVTKGLSLVRPSHYWEDFIEHFAYVFEFSDASVDHIRYHTYHLTSDLYLRYYLGGEDDAERMLAKYAELTKAMQSDRLAEPPSGIGYPHKDGLVSWDALRYLSVIRDLLEAKVLDERARIRIVEIGGGYGGLCRMVATLNPQVEYSIVDLEETLFFSKSYLDRALPDYDVRLIRHASELQFGEKCVNLIPQHLADELDGEFDLAVNHQSMQEMEVAQIDRYCDFISRHCDAFYSRNMRRQDLRIALRKGLSLDVQSQILERFPELLWKEAPDPSDSLIDENLPRFVVRVNEATQDRTPKSHVVPTQISSADRIEDRALHRGSMLDAHNLPVGSRFALTLKTPADLLVLTFVTWATTLARIKLGVAACDAQQGIVQHSSVICVGFRDWEEIVFDLRGMRRASNITLEVSVLELELEGRLGLPLFEPAAPAICSLRTGPSATDERVPAGRLLIAR